jgi:hypothetical protein
LQSATASSLEWLSSSNKATVVVLFGAGTMSYLESWQVRALASGLTDSRFRVLWALRSSGDAAATRAALPSPLPSSFKIKANFEQVRVLAHESVRLVVAPCGAASAQESLWFGKPLLCIPLFAEQASVAERVVEAGAGLRMDKWLLSEPHVGDLSRNVVHLVRNNTFRNAAKRLGKILRASGGTTLAADIVLRELHQHVRSGGGGAPLLPQPTQLACWHQVYHLDLWALAGALFILAVVLLRCAWLVGMAALAALVRWLLALTTVSAASTTAAGAISPQPASSAQPLLPRWLQQLLVKLLSALGESPLSVGAYAAGGSSSSQHPVHLNGHGAGGSGGSNVGGSGLNRPVFPAVTDGSAMLLSRSIPSSQGGGSVRPSAASASTDGQHSSSSVGGGGGSGSGRVRSASTDSMDSLSSFDIDDEDEDLDLDLDAVDADDDEATGFVPSAAALALAALGVEQRNNAPANGKHKTR